jgi:hypothetical protein
VTVYTSLPLSNIADDYRAGESLLTLANRHGVSKGTIRNVLAAAKVPLREPSRRATPTPHARTHTATSVYTYRSFDLEATVPDPLHPQEVARLRRAIGWRDDWAHPYDPVRGD